MKKLMLLLCCLIMSVCACGCNSDGSSSSNEGSAVAVADISCVEILDALKAEAVSMPSCSELKYDDDTFAKSYEKYLTMLPADNVADFDMIYSDDATADEIMVVKLNDASNVSELKDALEGRIERRRKQFDTYAPEEASRMDLAKIEACGSYVLFVICDNSADVVAKFKEVLAG